MESHPYPGIMRVFLCQLICLIVVPTLCLGYVDMYVSPYPARVYQQAPADLAVARVRASDNETGQPVTSFRLESRNDARYFKVGSDGVIRTKTTISFKVGRIFQFFVFAYGTNQYKHVKIEVSAKNEYAPRFLNQTYTFPVYRYGVADVIGKVTVEDDDVEDYNRHFSIFAQPGQEDFKYISLESDGVLRLSQPVPDEIDTLNVKLLAVDTGSPQRSGTTDVIVDVILVKQPETFCFSTTATTTTLCWKNPMPERAFDGYTVTVTGDSRRGDFLPYIDGHEEYCYPLNGTKVGEQYIFRVSVQSDDLWYGEEFDIVFNKSGIGYSRDCVEREFSWCSYRQPCRGHGTCVPAASRRSEDYSCDCDEDWKGENCTLQDLCFYDPCQNNGSCVFQGHESYRCECKSGYFGRQCEHFNKCLRDPCQNRGMCHIHDNGTYTCTCPAKFSGQNCENLDPCMPDPCQKGRGDCIRKSDYDWECACFKGYKGVHCEEVDACEINEDPCNSKGTCVPEGNDYYCICSPGSLGKQCETGDPCYLEPCRNHGVCSVSETGSYQCQCKPGFSGSECQTQDKCHGVSCGNGTCILNDVTEENSTSCNCTLGFYGDSCENYDVCRTSPCNDHGTCESARGSGDPEGHQSANKCTCFDEWYGDTCEYLNMCVMEMCKNGATCRNIPPDNYKCQCRDGFSGPDCSVFDPCSVHECLNGGRCRTVSSTRYDCVCSDEWVGARCEAENPCSQDRNPCQNQGRCEVTHDQAGLLTPLSGTFATGQGNVQARPVNIPQYKATCKCTQGHLGTFCEFVDPCLRKPCEHGECKHREFEDFNAGITPAPLASGTGSGFSRIAYPESADDILYCDCEANYTGRLCNVEVLSCRNIFCLNGGDCLHGECVCPEDFTGDLCETKINKCTEIKTPLEECVCEGDRQVCTKFCSTSHLLPQYRAALGEDIPTIQAEGSVLQFTMCVSDECRVRQCASNPCSAPSECTVLTRVCRSGEWGEGDNSGGSECLASASERLNQMASDTDDFQHLTAGQVADFTTKLKGLQSAVATDDELAKVALKVVSNLASVNVSVSEMVEKQNGSNAQLRDFVETYSADVKLNNGKVSVTSGDIEVKAVSLGDSLTGDNNIFNADGDSDVYIKLPKSELSGLQSRPDARISFVSYGRSQLFVPAGGFNDSEKDILAKQNVLSATVRNVQASFRNLSEPVEIKLKKLQAGRNHTCVFWNEQESRWSRQGVQTVEDPTSGQVTCKSTHLTSFAVLLSSTGEALPSEHEDALTYITYIGCAISMASLVITIVTYALFKVLRGEKSGKILLNLCVALLLLNTIFLVGTVDVSDFSNTTCVAVALMMHLLVLAALMWMLVEAIEMYQALVTVFTSYERLYLLKRCIIGWGIPVLIVAITAAVDISSYENKKENRDVCYLTSDNKATYYASLVAPACLIIIINTIIFIMVARVILKPRFQQQPASTGSVSVTPAQVRGAFAVMFLMGIPWIFGPLALREARVVFAYLFTICNSLQGFLIFVFRCLFNPEAKLAWIQLFTTGTLKRRRGPIKSMYTDTSSKGADSQGRRLSNSNSGTGYHASGTTRTTISKNGTGSHPHPHQLHTTNGWHPSLNGMRRESDYKDGPPGYSTNDSRSSSRSLSPLDRRSSEDLTTVVKRGSPPDEYGRPYPDEMTHF